jgi:uncharacterized protein (DUF433 family)
MEACRSVSKLIRVFVGGQPVIKGTRIPVSTILEQLAEDESWDSLLRGYPELVRDDVQAALEYARHSTISRGRTECYSD